MYYDRPLAIFAIVYLCPNVKENISSNFFLWLRRHKDKIRMSKKKFAIIKTASKRQKHDHQKQINYLTQFKTWCFIPKLDYKRMSIIFDARKSSHVGIRNSSWILI